MPPGEADATGLDFDAQCEAMLDAKPTVISSITGRCQPRFVQRMKDAGAGGDGRGPGEAVRRHDERFALHSRRRHDVDPTHRVSSAICLISAPTHRAAVGLYRTLASAVTSASGFMVGCSGRSRSRPKCRFAPAPKAHLLAPVATPPVSNRIASDRRRTDPGDSQQRSRWSAAWRWPACCRPVDRCRRRPRDYV